MIDFTILYAKDSVMAFRINAQLYFIKLEPHVPTIYDNTVKPLIIPNIDSWIQAKTHQRYSLSLLKELCHAFESGINAAFTKADVLTIAEYSAHMVLEELLHRGMIYDYAISYWIEVLGSDKIEEYLKIIASKLDYVVSRMGKRKLVRELNRIRHISFLRQINSQFICEKLLEKLDAKIEAPHYPETAKLDNKIKLNARNEVIKLIKKEFSTVPDDVIEVVNGILNVK